MFRRSSAIIVGLLFAVSSWAQESYLGIFLQGKKIGYTVSSTHDSKLGGKPMKEYRSKTVMNMGLLGSALSTVIDQTSWTAPNGRPVLMKYAMSSSGRSQKVEANFMVADVKLAIDNNGQLSTKTVRIPTDAPIVDDAMNELIEKGAVPGKAAEFYVLDPSTGTFVKNKATLIGPAKVLADGKEVDAIKATITEPRMTMTLYMTSKGDLVKAEAIGGMELLPITKEQALEAGDAGASADLAEMTKIGVEPPLENPALWASATYRFEGGDLTRAPNDASQRIQKNGADWVVAVTPVVPSSAPYTIAQAAGALPKWTASSLNVPAADPTLVAAAKKEIGKERQAVKAAFLLGAYVHRLMSPNAGIGVLRDAREVHKTREGVCRDYAILLASLMRSAKIPARVASGLVYDDGAFYYHAWVESWDGKNWYGVDSTRPALKLHVGYIKLAHGSVEDAFMYTFLDKSKATLVETKPKNKERAK